MLQAVKCIVNIGSHHISPVQHKPHHTELFRDIGHCWQCIRLMELFIIFIVDKNITDPNLSLCHQNKYICSFTIYLRFYLSLVQRMRLSDFVLIVFTVTDEFSDPLVLTEADRGQRKECGRRPGGALTHSQQTQLIVECTWTWTQPAPASTVTASASSGALGTGLQLRPLEAARPGLYSWYC